MVWCVSLSWVHHLWFGASPVVLCVSFSQVRPLWFGASHLVAPGPGLAWCARFGALIKELDADYV